MNSMMESVGISSQTTCFYQSAFIAAVTCFFLATVSSLPLFDQHDSYSAFANLIRVAAFFTIAAELLELIAAPIPMWRNKLCLMVIVGQGLFLWSADEKAQFNTGEGYLIAALLTSIAAELKILAIVLENRNFDKILQKEKYRFFQYGLIAAGLVLFMIGTLLLSLSEDKAWAVEKAGVVNCVGGVVYAFSIVGMFMKEKRSGSDFGM
jgi:hypothetical protein